MATAEQRHALAVEHRAKMLLASVERQAKYEGTEVDRLRQQVKLLEEQVRLLLEKSTTPACARGDRAEVVEVEGATLEVHFSIEPADRDICGWSPAYIALGDVYTVGTQSIGLLLSPSAEDDIRAAVEAQQRQAA